MSVPVSIGRQAEFSIESFLKRRGEYRGTLRDFVATALHERPTHIEDAIQLIDELVDLLSDAKTRLDFCHLTGVSVSSFKSGEFRFKLIGG